MNTQASAVVLVVAIATMLVVLGTIAMAIRGRTPIGGFIQGCVLRMLTPRGTERELTQRLKIRQGLYREVVADDEVTMNGGAGSPLLPAMVGSLLFSPRLEA